MTGCAYIYNIPRFKASTVVVGTLMNVSPKLNKKYFDLNFGAPCSGCLKLMASLFKTKYPYL